MENDVIYVGTGIDLRAYDATDLELLWTEDGRVSGLAIDDGILWVATCFNGVRAYR